jgi:hypothetical protein
VNEVNGDILKADQTNLVPLQIGYKGFSDYKYEVGKDGFIGVSADCENQILYIAKQKKPNQVFAVDLKLSKVIKQYDLSTGSDFDDDISDLFFKDQRLFVLQKNINNIAKVNPVLSESYVEQRYDFSSISELTTAKNENNDESGIAEALIVRNGSILLFLDQRKTNKANDDKSKDVIVELKI